MFDFLKEYAHFSFGRQPQSPETCSQLFSLRDYYNFEDVGVTVGVRNCVVLMLLSCGSHA